MRQNNKSDANLVSIFIPNTAQFLIVVFFTGDTIRIIGSGSEGQGGCGEREPPHPHAQKYNYDNVEHILL
jgi:hypothetical protein